MRRATFTAGVIGALVGLAASAQVPQTFVYDWDVPECISSTAELATVISDCMGLVMHPRGVAGGEQAELSVDTAAWLCRASRTGENSRALQSCVRSVLYERSGLGSRRAEVTPDDAAIACRYATSDVHGRQVESCMLRLLYARDGLSQSRTEMTANAAAYACQGVAAQPVWPYAYTCRPPSGEEATRFLQDCVRRLMYTRDGLGARREDITADAAAVACSGALSAYP